MVLLQLVACGRFVYNFSISIRATHVPVAWYTCSLLLQTHLKMDSPHCSPASRRASPIDEVERDLLIELVGAQPILSNRDTDGRIVALKNQAWEKIALHMNAAGHGERRTPYQYMKVWEHIKAK